MRVLINSKNRKKRIAVEAQLIKENAKTIIVVLPDGNIIKRHKDRDLVKED